MDRVMCDDAAPSWIDSRNSNGNNVKKRIAKDGSVIPGRACYGVFQRRYKKIFYYKERMMQWLCREPEVPSWKSVVREFETYMVIENIRPQELRRADVMTMFRVLGRQKYRENWKKMLYHLRGENPPLPCGDLVHDCVRTFKKIVKRFDMVNGRYMGGTWPQILYGSKGRTRHNMIHFNYLHRKIMESLGTVEWHREFPLLRTPLKVHQLDDATKLIFEDIGLPFTRTAVVQYPRCRQKPRRRKKN